jgi:hypothetical protein
MFAGIPVIFSPYVDRPRYFPPMRCIVARDAQQLDELLAWYNGREDLGDRCVEDLLRLFMESSVSPHLAAGAWPNSRR